MLTFEQIKELIELVAERKLTGLEIERSGFRLTVDGHQPVEKTVVAAPHQPAVSLAQPAPADAVPTAAPAPAAAPAAAAPAAPEAEAEGDGVPDDAHQVTSPIVGTFYRKPSPDQPAFVKEGDSVEEGQVLCIVEAMKLMNEIESDMAGTVVKIFPKDAQAVEYGEPLFAIVPH